MDIGTSKDFDQLKIALTTEPVLLHIFDPSQPVYLHTDWSTKAIGGWIGQERDGRLVPIAYESRKLHPAERNYSPYDGELLALVHCLRIFRAYLVNRPVIVRTDQKALKWLLDQRTLSHRQYRWLDLLQEFDLKLEWISGNSNTIADALSRRPHEAEQAIQTNAIQEIDHSNK